MRVLNIEWSPDGQQISFVAKQPVSALYVISADGGAPDRLPSGDAPVMSHSWSVNGDSMVIGEWFGTPAPVLRMLDLRARQLSVVPGSEGMIFPSWSPDGRYINATVVDGAKEGGWLYDVGKRQWSRLPVIGPSLWSRDGKYVYWKRQSQGEAEVARLRISDRMIEKVASLKGIRRADGEFGAWFGLDRDDAPMVLRDTGHEEVYALDWEAP